MRRLSYQEFQEEQDALTEAVGQAGYLAKFCSEMPWQSAGYQHLHGEEFGVAEPRETFIVEHNRHWLVFAERQKNMFFPFEAAWMFGCPLVGEPSGAIDLLETACQEFLGSGFGFVISGVLKGSEFDHSLTKLGERAFQYQEFDTLDCLTIDLKGGEEAFLERRSRSFRKSIRQMKPIDSLEFVDASSEEPKTVFERIFTIQSRSYKAKDGSDIFSDSCYLGFYQELYERLFQRNQIRMLFAQLGGKDVAYIMGGVSNGIYRGFQMSYDDNYRELALGNRLQLENIRRSHQESVSHYDLGMHSPYKERWADGCENYKAAFLVL